jgi:hypothetical protein
VSASMASASEDMGGAGGAGDNVRRTASASMTAPRPQRNAVTLVSAAVPLSWIACSIALPAIGMHPSW